MVGWRARSLLSVVRGSPAGCTHSRLGQLHRLRPDSTRAVFTASIGASKRRLEKLFGNSSPEPTAVRGPPLRLRPIGVRPNSALGTAARPGYDPHMTDVA